MLPFHYQDAQHTGNPDEANAFAFLLSDALDWAPGCYCERHAYFVFKASRDVMRPLVKQYDTAAIAGLVGHWNASHAVGGTIIRDGGMYHGEIEIFDATGHQAYHEVFAQPHSYFDLLGDMSVSALKFFGTPVSPALAAHLRVPRCKHFESIALLGKTAFMRSWSPEEFAVYKQILSNDPGFAEVRSWLAVGTYWTDGDWKAKGHQLAEALRDYVTQSTLNEFILSQPPDVPAADVERWTSTAVKLVDGDTPFHMQMELEACLRSRRWPAGTLDRALKTAAKYPNACPPLMAVANACERKEAGRPDQMMAASIWLAAMQDRYMLGSGSKTTVNKRFAYVMQWMGRYDLAVWALLPDGGDQPPVNVTTLMNDLFAMGQFDDVLKIYDQAAGHLGRWEGRAAARAAVAAAMLGRVDVIDDLIRDHGKDLAAADGLALAQAYRDLLTNADVDAQGLAKAIPKNDWSKAQYRILLAQLELKVKDHQYRHDIANFSQDDPGARIAWILLDGYFRQSAQPDDVYFYQSLDWLYPQDPWVRQAVSDWKKRGNPAADLSADAVMNALAQVPAERWTSANADTKAAGADHVVTEAQARKILESLSIWQATSAVIELTKQKQFDAAQRLALQWENVAARTSWNPWMDWFDQLAYRVDVARHNQ
jgi:hypothetical protein